MSAHNDDRTLEQIPLWNLVPSRWQPRDAQFDEEQLVELAHSIRDNGLINPVLVFSYDDADGCVVWELIAGERRTRAAIAIALAAAFPPVDVVAELTAIVQAGRDRPRAGADRAGGVHGTDRALGR